MRLLLILPRMEPSEMNLPAVCPYEGCLEVFAGLQTPALGGDLTSVKRSGEWLLLGLAVDDTTGLVLSVDALLDVPGPKQALVLTNRTPILPGKSAQQYCPINDDEYRTAIKQLAAIYPGDKWPLSRLAKAA